MVAIMKLMMPAPEAKINRVVDDEEQLDGGTSSPSILKNMIKVIEFESEVKVVPVASAAKVELAPEAEPGLKAELVLEAEFMLKAELTLEAGPFLAWKLEKG
ncbi:hypothetical protein CRG98_040764 [Punica granatum]|uniref:Uncharacterized protein n=1 Tax=Punica granatum TaxID=22663 RepID=A0A2I0I4B2_PUNGR|nr:hypothetical protein CRG98_040764 [Punica granatum]